MIVAYISWQLLGEEVRKRWRAFKDNPSPELFDAWLEAHEEAMRRLDLQAKILGLHIEEVSNL